MPNKDQNTDQSTGNNNTSDKTQDIVKGPDFVHVQNSDQRPKPEVIRNETPKT